MQELAKGAGIECATVRTTTLKKFASGSGRVDKVGMIQAAAAVLGRQPIDDNEADAVHVARWTAAEYA